MLPYILIFAFLPMTRIHTSFAVENPVYLEIKSSSTEDAEVQLMYTLRKKKLESYTILSYANFLQVCARPRHVRGGQSPPYEKDQNKCPIMGEVNLDSEFAVPCC